MPDTTSRFQLGAIEAMTVADEYGPMPVDRFNSIFNTADADDLRAAFAQLEAPQFSRNGLYLKTPAARVLVDTGEGRMVQNLSTAGVNPAQIDLLIITHFHGDHINGMTDSAGAAVFPNARVAVSQNEWTHWMSDKTLAEIGPERAQNLRKAFAPYAEAGRLDYFSDGQAITPEIRAVLMPGHTPGMMGLSITSGAVTLLHIADAAHVPLQGHFLERVPRFDSLPEIASATRRGVFERAATNGELLFAYHFPFPGVGRVTRSSDGYDWTPLAG